MADEAQSLPTNDETRSKSDASDHMVWFWCHSIETLARIWQQQKNYWLSYHYPKVTYNFISISIKSDANECGSTKVIRCQQLSADEKIEKSFVHRNTQTGTHLKYKKSAQTKGGETPICSSLAILPWEILCVGLFAASSSNSKGKYGVKPTKHCVERLRIQSSNLLNIVALLQTNNRS